MNVLILSASVGSGHVRAAQALELGLLGLDPGARVRHVDALALTNAVFRRVYGKGYFDLAACSPHLLSFLYDFLDSKMGPDARLPSRVWESFQAANLRALEALLEGEAWDLVVSTHFLPAQVAASLRRRGRLRAPLAVVVTDFDVHRIWLHEPCDLYLVASEETAASLRSLGVAAERVRVTGIPIHPDFGSLEPRDRCRADWGIAGDRPVVLQMCGGGGFGRVEETYRGLLACEEPLELVTVTARNEALRRRLKRLEIPSRHRVRVLGFVERMPRLMAGADLVVGKPGGLTVSEALACGLAFVVVDPIPGQESRNGDYLLENGAGVKINSLANLPAKMAGILREPGRLASMRSRAARLGRPASGRDAAVEALRLAGAAAPAA